MLKETICFIIISQFIVNCYCHYTNEWAVQMNGGQDEAKKVARDCGFVYSHEIIPGYYVFRHHSIRKRSLELSLVHHELLNNHEKVQWAEQQVVKMRVKRDLSNVAAFNDPLWPNMWYLNREDGSNMNVLGAYRIYNITGAGIHVTILDDGIEKNHPDLAQNYDPGSSYDINDQDDDPQPKYEYTDENKHGTRCAGEVAAVANNNICSVGVAYNSKIGGIRMLDGDVTDAVESQALGLNPNHIDIYSVSWGPEDNGMTVDGPGPLARKAIFDGIVKGRNGLGNIFVWASGNGGSKGDSCACDGYTNSIYTLSVSSVSDHGLIPWYSEPCASTMASTYSSGANGVERTIVTTDIRQRCTTEHTGTSASAPLAAGLCALVLEANNKLTWRDMQYVVFLTARPANLAAEDWVVNGVGKRVSHHFGFGLMDATAMVRVAKNWSKLPDHHRCATPSSYLLNSKIIDFRATESTIINTEACQGTTDNAVKYLEHVECIVTLEGTRRGEMTLYLTSPFGTVSQLLPRRTADYAHTGFKNWVFMTTHNWGENPKGTWNLTIINLDTNSVLKEWSLVFYGVATEPEVYKRHLNPTGVGLVNNPNSYLNNDAKNTFGFVDTNIKNINESTLKSIETTTLAISKIDKRCPEGQFLLGNSCVSACPAGYYTSTKDQHCLPCKPDCHICTNYENCILQLKVKDGKSWTSTVFIICALMAVLVISGVFMIFFLLKRRNYKIKKIMNLQPPSLFSNLPKGGKSLNNNRLLFQSSSLKTSDVKVPTLESSDISSVKVPLLINQESSSEEDCDYKDGQLNRSTPLTS